MSPLKCLLGPHTGHFGSEHRTWPATQSDPTDEGGLPSQGGMAWNNQAKAL